MELPAPSSLPIADAERLPVSFDFRGRAPSAANFFPAPPADAAEAAAGTFALRGRGLRFGQVALPNDAAAYIVRSSEGKKEVTHAVRRIGYYNHEAEISVADALPRALEWVAVAGVLHKELEVESAEDEDKKE